MRIVEDLLAEELPEKEVLVEGILRKRDIVSFGGRRKNGKTTLLSNLAMHLSAGAEMFLGHSITRPARVLALFFEDDPSQIKEKLERLYALLDPKRQMAVVTLDELISAGVPVSCTDERFRNYLYKQVSDFKPDVVMLDNLSHLVRGRYNDPEIIDNAFMLVRGLANTYGCAVIVAAHPRKRGKEDPKHKLNGDTEDFFEDIMGSSHFVNSADCLWGIEKIKGGGNYFLAGEQRRTGKEYLSVIDLDDDGVFRLTEGHSDKLTSVLTSQKRKDAWKLFKQAGAFKWDEMQPRCTMMKQSAFYDFKRELIRNGLVVKGEEDTWKVV